MTYKGMAVGFCVAAGLLLSGCDTLQTDPVTTHNEEVITQVENGEIKQGFVKSDIYDIEKRKWMAAIHSHGLRVVSFSVSGSILWLLIEKDNSL